MLLKRAAAAKKKRRTQPWTTGGWSLQVWRQSVTQREVQVVNAALAVGYSRFDSFENHGLDLSSVQTEQTSLNQAASVGATS